MLETKIYSLRIEPSNLVFDEIVYLKQLFRTKFSDQFLSKSIPHITIVTFKMDPVYEKYLVKAFNLLSSNISFELKINGFGVFENNVNVLFLNISESEQIKKIIEQVKIIWIKELHRKLSSLKITYCSHVTISTAENYTMLKNSYNFFQKFEPFNKPFQVDSLVLKSRTKLGTWDWEHHIALNG